MNTAAAKRVGVIGALALAGFLGGIAVTMHHAAAQAPVVRAVKVAAKVPACSTPAPTTAAGYTDLFASIPAAQWGAADVAITVPVSGRSVWLFGDTFSTGRFVHSTAITQRAGCLHVSHAGAQVLPNDDATHIYWIESGKATTGGLLITARSIRLVGTGTWGFADNGFSRTAYATVNAAGDVTFKHWVSKTVGAAPSAGALYSLGDGNTHHFGYARHAHPELQVEGTVLWTECQNWDDGVLHAFADYRPIFHAGPFA